VSSPLRKLGGRLLLLAVSTFVALALGELVVRALHLGPKRFPPLAHLENADKSAGLDVYPTNPRRSFDVDLSDAAQLAAQRARGLSGVDDAAKRTPYGVSFAYDAERCRDRAFAPHVAGTKRVIVLGDSFTEGQGVREQDTFARVLDRDLRPITKTPFELWNCGRRGRDFPALRETFDTLLVQEPDVILYAMVLNDPEQTKEFHDQQEFLNDWIVDRRRTANDDDAQVTFHGSALWGLVHERVEAARVARATTQWYLDLYGAPNQAGWDATKRHLAHMDQAMRARGGKLLVAVLPLMTQLEKGYPFAPAHAAISKACDELAIRCTDLFPAFEGQKTDELWVHSVDLHPNEKAHALIARALLPWVSRELE
jgi:lysophospholipase L1-like esterase